MSKILIVDDSALSRRMLRSILEGAGHAVVEAEDGLSALERFTLDRPDLTLLDLTMSGMHGFEVLEKMREVEPGVKVIVASADIQKSSYEMAAAKGGQGFIHKPFESDQVLEVVNSVLKGDSA